MARASRRFRKKRRNPDTYKRNPPLVTEVLEWAAPGFVGFAATRGLTRIATTQIAKRAPAYAAHAGAIASIGTFLAAWFLLNRVKFLQRYHTPIVVGSAIATAQSLIQIYTPPWASWLIDDPMSDLTGAAVDPLLADTATNTLPPGFQPVDDDPNDYVYNDGYDAGRSSAPAQQPVQQAQRPVDDDDMADLSVDGGIFS